MRLIKADAVIKAIDKHTFDTDDGLCLDDDISCILEEVPTIEERKKGEWIRHYCEDGNPDGWRCDQCAEWYYFGETKPNFCPNCGADMRGGQDGQIHH